MLQEPLDNLDPFALLRADKLLKELDQLLERNQLHPIHFFLSLRNNTEKIIIRKFTNVIYVSSPSLSSQRGLNFMLFSFHKQRNLFFPLVFIPQILLYISLGEKLVRTINNKVRIGMALKQNRSRIKLVIYINI